MTIDEIREIYYTQKGREEGREQGRQRGREQVKIAVATEMIIANEPIEKIIKYTKLTLEKIEELKNNM